MNKKDISNIQKAERLYTTNTNHQGCLMKIVEYINVHDIVVEFQDDYKTKVHTQYNNFKIGNVRNPYYPSVYGVGISGNKYPIWNDNGGSKEYRTWQDMIRRCYSKKLLITRPTYQNVTCCNEWLLYENFYEWLHSQENFDKWLNGEHWCLDKDISIKGNKFYSPETCCLVPNDVNLLFLKSDNSRGAMPIGVCKKEDKFQAYCDNQLIKKRIYLGLHDTIEKAFLAYKKYKEHLIKQIAKIEYEKGNITKKCYEAMMKYEVEIAD